jgi:hypothetical protein
MSTLFEDLRLVRPTYLHLVPRLSEMVYQHYQREVASRGDGSADLIDHGGDARRLPQGAHAAGAHRCGADTARRARLRQALLRYPGGRWLGEQVVSGVLWVARADMELISGLMSSMDLDCESRCHGDVYAGVR